MSPLHFTLHTLHSTHTLCKERVNINAATLFSYEVSICSAGEFFHSDVIYSVHALVIYRTSPNECVYPYTEK